MSEAELAIEEKLKRKRQEEQQAWQEYLQLRAKQRAKEEDDLRKLKERQARRKAQRAEDGKFMQEMRRKQEEQRQLELDERKRKEAEAKRQRLEEAEKKRLAMQQAIKQRDEAARRNFMVNKTAPGALAEAGPMVLGMQDVMKTKEQLAEDKKIALSIRIKPLKLDAGLGGAELKRTVNELWDTIVQLESDKYDLEEERKRQEYHLKELTERQKQINKNKALKLGLDPEDLSGQHPPKVRLASKYERRIDRRTFGEKTELFDGGYVDLTKRLTDADWAKRVDEYKQVHGDKQVPKWNPSAPRKEVVEPGQRTYDSDSEDEEQVALADKLRGFMEQQEAEAPAQAGSRRGSRAPEQGAAHESRRRSSQLTTSGVSSRRQSAAAKAPSPPPAAAAAAAVEEEEEPEGDEEDEEYEDEDEEYEEEDEEEE